ncbi:MAG: amidohydrolase [Acidobacteriia bacterium]|nr:amidohydrolase [Terriglobia bacterium]
MVPVQHLGCRAGCPDRRTFLGGLAAAAAGVLVSGREAEAAAPPQRIDVHHHLSPPTYLTELRSTLSRATLEWTPAKALEDMDRAGVTTALTSITTPGLWHGNDAAARRLARESNEYAARLAADHPGRFGLFVALSMPDLEGSLREVEYGLDTLKADGVGLITSYGDKWLGDPAWGPLYEELNRRKALVYTHPTAANCCRNLIPDVSDASIEYGTDTTRAIARWVFGGAAARYPDVRLIFSHAGGTMPFLSERFINLAKTPAMAPQFPQGFLPVAQKFYYDTAQSSNPPAMAALRKVIPLSQIVFGTDYPFRTASEHVQGLKECGVFNGKELRAIDSENALRLLPRFRTAK